MKYSREVFVLDIIIITSAFFQRRAARWGEVLVFCSYCLIVAMCHRLFVSPGFLVLTFTIAQSVSTGTITQAQIVTGAPSIWLYNQTSRSQCLCYALQNPPVVALNSYLMNLSCQLFSNLSQFSFQVISSLNVSVVLLQPLQPYTPCCSNLTWLLAQMKSNARSLNITSLESIALDIDRNRLGAVSNSSLQLISADPINSTFLSTGPPNNARPISYNRNLFYVGIFPPAVPYAFHIYAASNLTKVGSMNFTKGSPQRIVWLFNETLVCILTQNKSNSSTVNFHNWPSRSLNRSISVPITNAFGLGKAANDDTFVYITDGSSGGHVWRLRTLPPHNFSRFASTVNKRESPTNLDIDRCNRMWVAFYGLGVRIYDMNSTVMLHEWDMSLSAPYSSNVLDLVLTRQYQLYLADLSPGRLTSYGSALQCTSWGAWSFVHNPITFIPSPFSLINDGYDYRPVSKRWCSPI